MKNKKTVLWIALIVTTTISACVQQYDTRLNGTWKFDGDGLLVKYYNGNFEYSIPDDGTPILQGTYTTSGNKITHIPTYILGTGLGLDTRWYSKDEVSKDFFDFLKQVTSEYVINDNKLTGINTETGETSTAKLISRDGKFTQATSNSSKKSAP